MTDVPVTLVMTVFNIITEVNGLYL
jgi:hypothetical protein